MLETLCYHAQQATEKSLKAVLIYYSASVPRTHNIGTLIDLLEGYTEITESIRDIAILTEYAVSSRYPGFSEPVNRDDYDLALQLADRCFLWTKSIIDSKNIDKCD